MRRFVQIGALLIAVLLAASAWATPITFTDVTKFYAHGADPSEDLVYYRGEFVNKLEGPCDVVKWTHHFDFDPPASEVLSGKLTLFLRDDYDPSPLYCKLFTWEFGFFVAEDGTWDFGEIDTGNYSYGINASFLKDGLFTVKLVSVWGDFFIDRSELKVTYNPVPEPATMLLFGIGLCGLAFVGRERLIKER